MAKTGTVSVLLVVASLVGSAPPLFANGDTGGYPCYTIKESKRRGCFVCPVTCTPNEIDWKGKPIVIDKARVERRTQRVGLLLPVYKTLPGYHLCFTLSKGYDVLDRAPDRPFPQLEAAGRSFLQIGTVVFCVYLEKLDRHEVAILFAGNSESKGAVKVKALLDLPGEQ